MAIPIYWIAHSTSPEETEAPFCTATAVTVPLRKILKAQ